MIYVVGSGPAGVACAWALVQQGRQVCLLDAGVELEPERNRVVTQMGAQAPEAWDAASIAVLKENMASSIKGVPMKYVYGSDYPYRETQPHLPIESAGVDLMPSFARGGFSAVWGGAMLPYRAEDMQGWPIQRGELDAHYAKVLSFVDYSGTVDDLAAPFPLYCKSPQFLDPSPQAASLMQDLARNRERLTKKGIAFGYSRLAVRVKPTAQAPGCVYCGLCMYGCPYRLIYDSSSTLAVLQDKPNFRYVKDVVVRTLSERDGQVRLHAVTRQTGAPIEYTGERAYLAAGVLSTTAMLLQSMEAYGQPLTMHDSQYFLLPMLRLRNTPGVLTQHLHTLAQLFLEITDKRISPHSIHLQLYTYNDLYRQALKNLSGPLFPLLTLPVKQLLGRLLIAQGYLHSRESSAATVQLEPGIGGAPPRLVLTAQRNPGTLKAVWKVVAKLFGSAHLLRALPMPLTLYIAKPGRGFHSGGTFPMAQSPARFQSDLLGRPQGFQRVHIVDSTCFPSIPATTITLSVMANAHRIASAYGDT